MRKIRDLRPPLFLRTPSTRGLPLFVRSLVSRFIHLIRRIEINFPPIPRDPVHATHSLMLASIIFDAVFARRAYRAATLLSFLYSR